MIATIPLVRGQNLCPKHCGGGEVDPGEAAYRCGVPLLVSRLRHQIERRLAASLDILRSEVSRLEALYHPNLAALDDLKKSILHQAFSSAL